MNILWKTMKWFIEMLLNVFIAPFTMLLNAGNFNIPAIVWMPTLAGIIVLVWFFFMK